MGLKESFLWARKQLGNAISGDVAISRASKGISKDFYSGLLTFENAIQPSQSLDTLKELFLKDPEVQAALTTRVNAILSSGYTIEGTERQKKDSENKLKKVGFNKSFLRQLVLNYILYNHVFVENVKGQEVHLLETTQMEIDADKHGEIINFIQRPNTGENIVFSPDEVTYITPNKLTTGVWGYLELESLFRAVNTKNFIEKFIGYLAETNQWRNVMRVNGMDDDEIKNMLSYYRSTSYNPTVPFTFKGDKEGFETYPMRDASELNHFIQMLEYQRTKILMLLKVPPIMIGVPDNSNRSNSDSQMKAFSMNVSSDREILAEAFNNDLFKKIGVSGVFSWNPIDKHSEKDDIEIAEKLVNMGADKDQIELFLRNAGLDLPVGKLFKEVEPMQDPTVKKSMDQFPSRQKKPEDQVSKNIGTGAESTTRENQL